MSQAQFPNPSVYSDCICLPGTTGQQACSPCPQGSWCPGNGVQNACPPNASSLANSSSQNQCSCLPGYMLPNSSSITSEGCKLCPINETCISGIMSPCRPFSQTLTEGQTKCICVPGFYSNSTSDVCNICPSNHYCPGNVSIIPCTPNSTAPRGQYSSAACSCNPGFVFQGQACVACPQGFYCPGGLAPATACPLQSYSLPLAFSLDQCLCIPGYFALTRNWCAICSGGTYSSVANSSSCLTCQPGTYSIQSVAATVCTSCVQGTFSTLLGAFSSVSCRLCAAGTYSSALASALPCINCSQVSSLVFV